MAFVAITAGNVTFRGRSGKIYTQTITKATAVGFCTIGNGDMTFIEFPEDVALVDCTIADTVNAADYLRFDIGGFQNVFRVIGGNVLSTLAPPHIPVALGPIPAGKKVQIYWYSA